MEVIIDANIIIRHLTDDHKKLSAKATQILEENEKILVFPIVIAEVIWTLSSFYKYEKSDINSLKVLLSNPKFEIQSKELVLDAISLYCESSLSYIDAFLLLQSKKKKASLKTFDSKLNKLAG